MKNKNPIIIVEGIDRVGKTTLCNMLSEATGFPIYKYDESVVSYDKMDNDNETDKMRQLIKLHELTNAGGVIFDRFHMSDFVYGILNRKYCTLHARDNLLLIDSDLSATEAIVILVDPVDIKYSSDMHGSDLSMHCLFFSYAFLKSKCCTLATDYNHLDACVNCVKELIE